MKRIFITLLVVLSIFGLASCVTTRAQKPVLEGFDKTPKIRLGESFDPLEGITARDKAGGKDITSDIVLIGWDEENLEKPGYYEYTIKITNKGGLEDSVEILLTILTAEGEEPNTPVIVGAKTNETFFIGSPIWSPKDGVTAKAPDGTDITNLLKITGTYLLDAVGAYIITYSVEYEGVRARKTLTLNVVSSEIPLELTKDPITITFNHAMGKETKDYIIAYAKAFTEEYNAKGHNITIVIPDGTGGYDTLKANTINQITAGNMPNMVQGYPDHVAEYLNGKAVLDLTPYINHEKWGLVGPDAFEDIIEVYRNENSQYDTAGTFYSLPFNKSTEIMTYNKTALNAVADKRLLATNPGATEAEKNAAREAIVPKTWQDIIELDADLRAYAREMYEKEVKAAKPTLTEAQITTEVNQKMELFRSAALDSLGNAFITLTRQFDGKYTALNPDFTGQFLWKDDANTITAMEFIKNAKNVITIPKFWDQQYASTPFLAGQTFITIGSSAGIRYNNPGNKFELGAAPVPYNAEKPELKQVIQQGTNISLMKTGNSQQMLVSWLFLKHLIKTENTADWAMKTGYLPVRVSAYESPTFQAFLNNPTNAQKLISISANASYLQSANMFYDPAFIGSSRAREQVGLALERIMTGDGDIRAALTYAYNEANLGG